MISFIIFIAGCFFGIVVTSFFISPEKIKQIEKIKLENLEKELLLKCQFAEKMATAINNPLKETLEDFKKQSDRKFEESMLRLNLEKEEAIQKSKNETFEDFKKYPWM